MPRHTKLTLTALAAALTMAAVVSTAHANHLSMTNTAFRNVWASLRFFGEGGIAGESRCPVTLEGTFHSATIVKSIGALVGYVTRATSGSGAACAHGSSTILQETLPWHVTYEGFSGTLPRITRVRYLLRGMSFKAEPGFGTCKYGHPEENAAAETNVGASGEANSLTVDSNIRLRGFGEFGCPPEGGFEGTTSSLTVLGTTTRITVRLI